jgi:hypothetical protein
MNLPQLPLVRNKLLLLTIAVGLCFQAAAQKKGGGAPAAASAAPSSPSGATASNAPVEVEWLGYSALDKVMEKVADYSCGSRIGTDSIDKVVVLDPPSLQALQAYDSFYWQAESLSAAFADMAPRSGAGGGIDDFADITGAVAAAAVSTTSETSFSFTIQDPTAAIVLLGKLRKKDPGGCKNAYYAGVYAVSDAERPDVDAMLYQAPKDDAPASVKAQGPTKQLSTKKLASVPEELNGLAATRQQTLLTILGKLSTTSPLACKAIATPVQSSSFTGQPGWTPPDPASWTVTLPKSGAWAPPTPPADGSTKPTPPSTSVSSTDPCVSAFNNLDGTYNSFLTSLSTPNSTTGQSAVSAAQQGYGLRELFESATDSKKVLGIYISIAAAGGTQQDRKNLITALFTGDWIRYSGGVSVNVIVFEMAGKKSSSSTILFSDLVRFRTPLTTIKTPSDKKDLDEGDNLKVLGK